MTKTGEIEAPRPSPLAREAEDQTMREKHAAPRSKKARQAGHSEKAKGSTRPALERQLERENQTGRGSGEGKSGLQRGDGHPTGR
jgi:hypothetical protein